MIQCQQTFIVGLGASGRQFLECLKTRISQRYGDLPAFKLLAVDVPQPATAMMGGAASEARYQILDPSEIQELPLDDLVNASQMKNLYPWLPDDVVALGNDWVQTRSAARVALHYYAQTILGKLEYQISQLGTIETRETMNEKGFEIASDLNQGGLIIVGSLGELACTGLLTDMTALVHYLFRRTGLQSVIARALLFMPPTDPYSESLAYASLKELNSVLLQQTYRAEFTTVPVQVDGSLFNGGCYLLDMRNEKNLRLNSQEDLTTLSAEWVFRMLTTGMMGRVDDFVGAQATNPRAQGLAPVFASVGLSSYILPVHDLIDWSSYKLVAQVLQGQVLASEFFSKVSDRLIAFYNSTPLRPDDLMDKALGVTPKGNSIRKDEEIRRRMQGLRAVPLDQTIEQFQRTSQSISASLPKLRQQIEANASEFLFTAQGRITTEIGEILKALPQGGLSLAGQFASRLQSDFDEYAKTLNRREVAFSERSKLDSARLKLLGTELEKTVSAIPSLWLLIAFLIAGLFAPLVLTSFWLKDSSLGLVGLLVIWLGSVGMAAWAYYRTTNEVDEVRNRFIRELETRFDQEIGLALVHTARSLYPEISSYLTQELERLRVFTEQLQNFSRECRSHQDPQVLCGEFGFSLQRSVLTPDLVDELYTRFLGQNGPGARLIPMFEQAGSLDTWEHLPVDALRERLLDFGRGVFKDMETLKVEPMLKELLGSPAKMERSANDLLTRSAPLMSFEMASLGLGYNPQLQTFVGMANAEDSDFARLFILLNPTILSLSIDDPYTLVVTSLRQGVPGFGLRLFNEMRSNYIHQIRSGDVPLHVDDRSFLLPDLEPIPTNLRLPLSAPATLAIGLALGLVKARPDGVLGFMPSPTKDPVYLDKDRVNSAIMLGADAAALRALNDQIYTVTEEKSASDTARQLEETLRTPPDLSDWERKALQSFVRDLHG